MFVWVDRSPPVCYVCESLPVDTWFLDTYDVPVVWTEMDDVGLCRRAVIHVDLIDTQLGGCGGGGFVARMDTGFGELAWSLVGKWKGVECLPTGAGDNMTLQLAVGMGIVGSSS